jgi:hypothetical protein
MFGDGARLFGVAVHLVGQRRQIIEFSSSRSLATNSTSMWRPYRSP